MGYEYRTKASADWNDQGDASLAFSADGKVLACGNLYDSAIALYNPASGLYPGFFGRSWIWAETKDCLVGIQP